MNSNDGAILALVLVCSVFFFGVGYGLATENKTEEWQLHAIEKEYGYYDSKTGKFKFIDFKTGRVEK